jgi:hypothetical protein
MNINEAFPSDYLKASDLGNKSVTVTIESVELTDIGQGRDKEQKILIRFVGKQKGLICNKTNANTIGKLYGIETDGWLGKRIILQTREVEFAGEAVWAIRVSLQKPLGTQPSVSRPQPDPDHGMLGKPHSRTEPPTQIPPAEDPQQEDSEIPF